MIISVAGCWSATLIVPENIKKEDEMLNMKI